MTVFVDVEPRFDDEASKAAAEAVTVNIRDAVAQGVRDALEALAFGLSMTPDEIQALEKYRNNKAANLRRARAHVAKSLNKG
jgi:hypothetical protein